MQISRALIFIAAWAVLLCCLTIRLSAQGADQFTINIPRKPTTAFRPIREIKAVVALSSPVTAAAPVTFKFTDQAPLSNSTSATCNPNCTFSPHFTPSIPTVPPTDCSMSNIGCFTDNEQGPNSSGPDEIVVYPAGLPGDPARYEMDFFLQSNHGPGNSCANTQQVDPNSYTVTIGSPSAKQDHRSMPGNFRFRIVRFLQQLEHCCARDSHTPRQCRRQSRHGKHSDAADSRMLQG